MKEKRWILRKDYDAEAVENIRKLGASEVVATLLAERGITNRDEAISFFNPHLSNLHDPFMMKDMDKVVERVREAIANNENILVYGDYDTDGTTAVALVYSFLEKRYRNIDFYVPDRYKEGYGISIEGIDYASEHGVKLVIALDCGIRANEQIAYANEKNIDVIVADHHLPGDELPAAFAIVDPKRNDCPYPCKELSGCGIGFKIVEAILESEYGVRMCDRITDENNPLCSKYRQLEKELWEYIDLTVVSIASDIVPITGENRILAYFGLRKINKSPRPGIEAILLYGNIKRAETLPDKKNYFSKEINISDLVFLVGPRINAAGRIKDARDSVRLLLCKGFSEAKKIAGEINDYNRQRKELDRQVTDEAKCTINRNPDLQKKKTIVLFDKSWHKGVIGIVASRLVEEYYKPTIVFTLSGDLYTGSARSVKDFDIYSAIDRCSDLLEHFGGHKYAAGVALRPENFDKFVERFENIVADTIPQNQTIPEIEIDAVIDFHDDVDNDPNFLNILKKFAPFGPGNMLPIFATGNLVDTGYAREVGNDSPKHLKFEVTQINKTSKQYPAIGFSLGEYAEEIRNGAHFYICYHIEENFWQGRTETQLNVKDLRLGDEKPFDEEPFDEF